MKFKFRYAEQIVGIFIIAAIVFLGAAIVLIGGNQRWFDKSYQFNSRFNSATGLSRGLAIRLSGFEIGKITKISLTEENHVDVQFVIYEEFHTRVHPGSVIELISDPLGLSRELVFYPGRDTSRLLEENSYIPSMDTPEGRDLVRRNLAVRPEKSDMIGTLIGSIEPLLEDINKIAATLDETLGSVGDLVRSIDGAVTGTRDGTLTSTLVHVKNLTAITEELLAGEISGMIKEAAVISENLRIFSEILQEPEEMLPRLLGAKGSIASFLDDDNEIYDTISGSLRAVEESLLQMRDMTHTLGESAPQISVLLSETLQAIEDGRKVMEGLQTNPLLRRGIEQEKPQPGSQSGFRDREF